MNERERKRERVSERERERARERECVRERDYIFVINPFHCLGRVAVNSGPQTI